MCVAEREHSKARSCLVLGCHISSLTPQCIALFLSARNHRVRLRRNLSVMGQPAPDPPLCARLPDILSTIDTGVRLWGTLEGPFFLGHTYHPPPLLPCMPFTLDIC